jgi:hypothetical protein
MNFINTFYKNKIIHLVAIDPMGQETIKAEPFDEKKKAKKWAQDLNSKGFNIYFTVNNPKPIKKKATKNDIKEILAAWVDIDPDKNKNREKERTRIKALIDDLDLKPSAIIDSGNGYAVYWYYEKPLDADAGNIELAEQINIALQKKLGGDNCHNVDRVMRYPDMINYPTPQKIRAGYEQSQSSTVLANGVRYKPNQLIKWVGGIKEEAKTAISKDNEKLQLLLDNDGRVAALWEGTPTENQADTSRSGYDMTLLAMLKGRGLSEEETLGALYLFEHGKINEQRFPEKYFRKMWRDTNVKQPLLFNIRGADFLTKQYAYVKDQDRYFDGLSGIFMTPTVFNNIHLKQFPGGKNGPKAHESFLLEETAIIVDTVTWLPGAGRLLKEGNTNKLNLYVEPTMETTEGDVTPWLLHMAYLIPDEEQREHLLNWMAFTMQRPGIKINHQILMAGTPRIGKDTAFCPIVEYFGSQNVSHPQAEQMHNAHNEFLNGKKLIMVEEIMNYEKRTYENQLKPLCAAPPKFLHINPKGMRQYEIHNVVSIVFFSNEPDAISIRTKGDTRYFCLWCGMARKDEQYYIDFWKWLYEGGNEAVAGWLLRRDVTSFRHGGGAPETEYRREIGAMSLSGMEVAIHEAIAAHIEPFDNDLVTVAEIIEKFAERGIKNPARAGVLLKKYGAEKFECSYKEDKKTKKLYIWAIRNIEKYKTMHEISPTDLVNLYKNQM